MMGDDVGSISQRIRGGSHFKSGETFYPSHLATVFKVPRNVVQVALTYMESQGEVEVVRRSERGINYRRKMLNHWPRMKWREHTNRELYAPIDILHLRREGLWPNPYAR